jgi:hypothetical protein
MILASSAISSDLLQAPGRVDQGDVGAFFLGALDAFERNAGGVRTLRRSDERCVRAIGPHFELFDRRGAEGVGGADDHLGAGIGEIVGELADRRGFARTVDADDEHDARLHAIGEIEMRFARLQNARDFHRKRFARFLLAVFFAEALIGKGVRNARCGRGAHVGGDQHLFEFGDVGGVELFLGEDRGEAVGEFGR